MAVVVVVAGAVAVTLAALWYWHGAWRVPLVYGGDALLYDRLAKTVSEGGWYLTNPLLGVPGGQALYDYPLGSDNLHLIVFRVVALGTSNPFQIVNTFYYLTFPLVFVAAWYSFRRLGLAMLLAAPLAAVYALAPFHFSRNVTHLFLSGYYAVPLACLLLYELLGEAEETDEESGAPAWTLRRFLRSRAFWLGRWLWVPVLLGSTGAYFAFFFVILAAAIGLLGAIYRRDPRLLRRPALAVAVTLGVLLLNNLPTFLYRLDHGTNEVVAGRKLGESDISALQWSHLVLPVDGHRVEPLADVRARLHGSVSPLAANEQDALGLVAAAGLVISVGALLVDRRRDGWAVLRRRSGVLNVLAVLLGTAGGASVLLGMAGFLQLRAYARLTLFIGFFSLVALGAALAPVLETARRRWPRRTMRIAGALAVLVPLLALLDQTPRTRPGGSADVAAADRDRELAAAVDRRLPPGATVLQMPLLGFPEDAAKFPPRVPAVNAVVAGEEVYNGYELFRPTLYTDDVGWSYGRMQARPGDVVASYAGKPLNRLLPEALAAGFDGIHVDRAGFPDYALQLEAELTALVGPPAAVTSDNRSLFFDLRDYARRWDAETPPEVAAQIRRHARHPLELEWGEGFGEADGVGRFFPRLTGFTSGRGAGEGRAELEVRNPTAEQRVLELHVTARLGGAGTGRLLVEPAVDGGDTAIAATGTHVTVRVPAPPGITRVTFVAEAPATGDGAPTPPVEFRLEDVWWTG